MLWCALARVGDGLEQSLLNSSGSGTNAALDTVRECVIDGEPIYVGSVRLVQRMDASNRLRLVRVICVELADQ